MKVTGVQFRRNGSAGNGYHVVFFSRGRGAAGENFVGVVFSERRKVAVLGLSPADFLYTSWDGPYYEDELREAVLEYERGRSTLTPSEERDLKFGIHECVPNDGVTHPTGLLKGQCVVCRRSP